MTADNAAMHRMPEAERIVRAILSHAQVDAIYLYGSRAKRTAHEHSDWDIAVIYSNYETDPIERQLRPQLLEAEIERELKLYNQISVVDLEIAPIYLQYSILMSAEKWFDRNVPHVKRVEQGILSTWEKDYERYCLRTSVAHTSAQNAENSGRIRVGKFGAMDRT